LVALSCMHARIVLHGCRDAVIDLWVLIRCSQAATRIPGKNKNRHCAELLSQQRCFRGNEILIRLYHILEEGVNIFQ